MHTTLLKQAAEKLQMVISFKFLYNQIYLKPNNLSEFIFAHYQNPKVLQEFVFAKRL